MRGTLTLALVLVAAAGANGRQTCGGVVGGVRTHIVATGESLAAISARAGLSIATLVRDNGLRADARLRPGQTLLVDNRHLVPDVGGSGIVVNVPQRMLFLLDEGRAVSAYPIAAGQPTWRTPLGTFEIAMMEVDPTWDVPVSIQREIAQQGKRVVTKVLPGPQNPLGDRWLGVSDTGIGIHGTNAPSSIYRLSTHGCIRLHPADIRDLFDRVTVGTQVRIIYEPVLFTDDVSGIWVEVHDDAYRAAGPLLPHARMRLTEKDLDGAIDAEALRTCVERRSGRACDITPQ